MIGTFVQFIEEKNLCTQKEKILLALSGGIDSVVMLDLFSKANFDFAVAHCNFKLRGKESDEDEKFVRLLAESYNVKEYVKSFDTNSYAKENKCSIQEAARELRYNWFAELCKENGFDKIVVAHHLDDQIETFFINLFRGSGVKGLKGIPVKRGNIIRPLLFASRDEIEKYANDENLEFRTDSSNSSDKYLRNKIRHYLLPVINDLKPGFQDQLLQALDFLKEDSEVLEALLAEKRNALVQKNKSNIKIEIDSVKGLSSAEFYYLLSEYGFNRSVTDDILECLFSGNSGKIFYSDTYRLLIDRIFLFLDDISVKINSYEYEIAEPDSELIEPIHLLLNKFTPDSIFRINKNQKFAYFDFDKLSFPLKLRKWIQGDRFTPFGMKGSKLVSDYLIDSKVSRFDKEHVWVLLSGNEIIWVVGHRPSDHFKLVNDTKNGIEVKLV